MITNQNVSRISGDENNRLKEIELTNGQIVRFWYDEDDNLVETKIEATEVIPEEPQEEKPTPKDEAVEKEGSKEAYAIPPPPPFKKQAPPPPPITNLPAENSAIKEDAEPKNVEEKREEKITPPPPPQPKKEETEVAPPTAPPAKEEVAEEKPPMTEAFGERFCHNCNGKISQTAVFCGNCGVKQ